MSYLTCLHKIDCLLLSVGRTKNRSMNDEQLLISNALEYITRHPDCQAIRKMYRIGPIEGRGFAWTDVSAHPEMDEECKKAWKIMEEYVLNQGFDSGGSYSCAQRSIQYAVKRLDDDYIFHEE